jgi:hypothetical protein
MQGNTRQQRPHIMELGCGFCLFQGTKDKTVPPVNHGSVCGPGAVTAKGLTAHLHNARCAKLYCLEGWLSVVKNFVLSLQD